MIACLVVPAFDLKAALRTRTPDERPAALAPAAGQEPLIGSVTETAEALGVRRGMRLGEALSICPGLVLVEQDPAEVERAWEGILRALEETGFAVEPAGLGCVYFESGGVERLYGGLEPTLRRALAAVGSAWEPRVGAAGRRFAALAAANSARPGRFLVVSDERLAEFLAPLPLELIPLERRQARELRELGLRRLGELAALPGVAAAERLGTDGRRAWSLAQGGQSSAVRGRRPPTELVEALEFPEAVANELTLQRGFATLLERILARPERKRRFVRKALLGARLATGGSWRRPVSLREATSEPDRLSSALAPKLTELPAPVLELRLELLELADEEGRQLELLPTAGAAIDARLRETLRQVRAAVGSGSLCTVVEVAPWSRIPEARALLVPRDG